jgi:hypothetical protein
MFYVILQLSYKMFYIIDKVTCKIKESFIDLELAKQYLLYLTMLDSHRNNDYISAYISGYWITKFPYYYNEDIDNIYLVELFTKFITTEKLNLLTLYESNKYENCRKDFMIFMKQTKRIK